jgi:hypothetical protein
MLTNERPFVNRRTTFVTIAPRRSAARERRKKPEEDMGRSSRIQLRALGFAAAMLAAIPAQAQPAAKYDPGANDKAIKIGTTAPLSGPVSAFAQIAKSAEAYFKKVNDEGGVNGRRIEMIIVDDAYSPPKTVEQTRRLVESDEVLLVFGGVGTPTTPCTNISTTGRCRNCSSAPVRQVGRSKNFRGPWRGNRPTATKRSRTPNTSRPAIRREVGISIRTTISERIT